MQPTEKAGFSVGQDVPDCAFLPDQTWSTSPLVAGWVLDEAPILLGQQSLQRGRGIRRRAELQRPAAVNRALEIVNEGQARGAGLDMAAHPLAAFYRQHVVHILREIGEDLLALQWSGLRGRVRGARRAWDISGFADFLPDQQARTMQTDPYGSRRE